MNALLLRNVCKIYDVGPTQHDLPCYLRTFGYQILKFQVVSKFKNHENFKKKTSKNILLERLHIDECNENISILKTVLSTKRKKEHKNGNF